MHVFGNRFLYIFFNQNVSSYLEPCRVHDTINVPQDKTSLPMKRVSRCMKFKLRTASPSAFNSKNMLFLNSFLNNVRLQPQIARAHKTNKEGINGIKTEEYVFSSRFPL